MSDISGSSEEQKTPMARRPSQDMAYFTMQDASRTDYGITSLATEASAVDDELNIRMDSIDVLMAQQELVSRALSPTHSGTSWASPASSQSGQRKQEPSTDVKRNLSFRDDGDSVSSRPDTPLSQPSLLPVPSNPSTFPDDQLSTVPGPSLVMPEIRVTQRRPYTEAGKNVGKLRIMFCGDSASGKTTLLRTLANRSPDIVFLEDATGSEPGRSTTEINEIRASSQPYPAWRILSSADRQDRSELVMERNLCFVDTPGFGLSAETDDAIDPILQYIESQLSKTNQILRDNKFLNDDDFLNLIAAPQGGFTQVDVVVYCIAKKLTEVDVSFIQKLANLTSVIPVVTQIDKRTKEETIALRADVTSQLQSVLFRYFEPFAKTVEQPLLISCSDPEIECSLMMQDDYAPNLVPSDLSDLLSMLLHHQHPARLRHLTAQKFLAWKSRYQQSLVHMPEESDHQTLLPSADFTISRIAEHTRQEDRKTRLRIAAWANEMRTSFAISRSGAGEGGVGGCTDNNNNDYTASEKSAEWLIARMNAYVEEEKRGSLYRASHTGVGSGKDNYIDEKGRTFIDEADPLGLLRLRERWARRVRRAVKWCFELGVAASVSLFCWHAWLRITL